MSTSITRDILKSRYLPDAVGLCFGVAVSAFPKGIPLARGACFLVPDSQEATVSYRPGIR